MYLNIIGILHFLCAILISLYGLICKKNQYDQVYLFYIIILLISWTIYDGECLISYYSKIAKDPNYISGYDTSDLDDMYEVIGKDNKIVIDIIMILTHVSHIISIYIVSSRNDYPPIISIGLAFIYATYTSYLRLNLDDYNFIHQFYKVISISFLFFMLKKEKII